MRAHGFVYFLIIAIHYNVNAGLSTDQFHPIHPSTNMHKSYQGVPTKLRVQRRSTIEDEISENLIYMKQTVQAVKNDIHSLMSYIPEKAKFEKLLDDCKSIQPPTNKLPTHSKVDTNEDKRGSGRGRQHRHRHHRHHHHHHHYYE